MRIFAEEGRQTSNSGVIESVDFQYFRTLYLWNFRKYGQQVFDLPGGWQGLTPPLDEDDLPNGGRKFWSGGQLQSH